MIGEVWARLRRDTRARIGLVVVAMLVLLAILAPLLARHDPIRVDLLRQLEPPSAEHWMGTDMQGRDVWARLVYGARISLAVGLISQSIALALGLSLGLIAGYYGRWVDDLVMRLADITLAFPTLLLLIAMVAALQPSLIVVFVTVGLVGWAGMARLVRGQVLVVRQLEYVQAARALGAPDRAHHLAPRPPERHRARRHRGDARHGRRDHGRGGAVVPRPWRAAADAELGLDDRRRPRSEPAADAPWTSLFPGLAIGVTVLGLQLLGDALRDALDPRAASKVSMSVAERTRT